MEVPQQAGDIRVKIKHAENVNYVNCTFYGDQPCKSEYDKILEKKIKRLKRNYEKDNMPSLLWHDDSKDLPLANYFISLTVDEDHLLGRFPIGESIQLNQIFVTKDVDGNIRRKRRILVRGNPGYGKSTLIRKLAYDWATIKSPNYLEEMFKVVVIIPIKNLQDRTVKEAVISEMSGNDEELFLQALQKSQLTFLLLLDGYDEAIETDNVLKFLKEEEDEEFFLDVTIVITSRPQAIQSIWKEFDRHLSVLGFSNENQIAYIKNVLGHQKEKMENILEKLNSNQFLSELSKCPLMLHMFCCLQSETDTAPLNTLTELYIELIRLLIIRYTRKHPGISLYQEGSYFVGENLIFKLGKLASCYFGKNSAHVTAISEVDLRETFPEENDFKFVTGLDILIPVATTKGNSKLLNYDFMHRTIAEFLAMFYITKLPKLNLNLYFSELLLPSNNLPVICFCFGLMGEKIVEHEYLLKRLTNKHWEADWIPRLKEEMSRTTWDKLFLRQYVKKLSCVTHNFKRDAMWISLHQHLEELVAKINPNVYNWDDVRTDVVEIIESCKYLTSLTIYICPCSQFRIMYDNIGTSLLINIHFLMDDLIKISSLNLKVFSINIGDFNLATSDDCTLVKSCAVDQTIGFRSCYNIGLNIALWNIGKMEFRVSFEKSKENNVKWVVLLMSQEQYDRVKQNTREPIVLVEGKTIVSMDSVRT